MSHTKEVYRVTMNLTMTADVVGLFADAWLFALVRSAGQHGALTVNEAAYRGDVPVSLELRGAVAMEGSVTTWNTVAPLRAFFEAGQSSVVNVSAHSWSLASQGPSFNAGQSIGAQLPVTRVCSISHYHTLIEVRDVLRCLDPGDVTIHDQCPQQACIPDYFGKGCKSLSSLLFASCGNPQLSPLNTITTIQGSFLTGCSRLRRLSLAPLSNVTAVGDQFLSECNSLEEVDLSPLSNVTSVGPQFMYGCASVRKLDVSPLSKITAFEGSFLAGCSQLEEVNLEAIDGVTSVGRCFMHQCSRLRRLSLAPLSNVTAVGEQFLYECSSLEEVDLSPLSNVTSVGPHFMYGCGRVVVGVSDFVRGMRGRGGRCWRGG